MIKKERIYLFDNLKAILILCVVFGHLLEPLIKEEAIKTVYMVIYSFHIPLFAICSGYFARFSPVSIRKKLIYPFLVFQLLYLLFDKLCLGNDAAFTFTKPYWLMWYLFAFIIWEMLLPLLETASPVKRLLLLIFFTACGILCGFDEKIGYYLSLSRIIVYFPFFLGAYYLKQMQLLQRIMLFAKSRLGKLLSIACVFLSMAYIAYSQASYKVSWLYGSTSYKSGHYGPQERLLFYFFAVIWIVFLIGFVPNRHLPLSSIGENSLYIYLLHGFIVRYLNQELHLLHSMEYQMPAALLLAIALVLLLSRKVVRRLFSPLIRLP